MILVKENKGLKFCNEDKDSVFRDENKDLIFRNVSVFVTCSCGCAVSPDRAPQLDVRPVEQLVQAPRGGQVVLLAGGLSVLLLLLLI